MKKSAHQSGQTLLIILLVMAVGLTISLSLISRSITDIRISQQEEESARAFSVAEAGIEESLRAGSATPVTIGNITATVTEIARGVGREFDFEGDKFAKGDTQTVWLIEHTNGGLGGSSFPANGTINLCWGDSTDINDQTPAVEASIIYKDGAVYKVARGAYDPNSARRGTNKFDGVDGLGGGNCSSSLAFRKNIVLSGLGVPGGATLYVLRLRLFYNDQPQPLAVSGSANFPSQGRCYVSTATVPESDITRKVRQCQSHKVPPAIFDYVLFSKGDLTK